MCGPSLLRDQRVTMSFSSAGNVFPGSHLPIKTPSNDPTLSLLNIHSQCYLSLTSPRESSALLLLEPNLQLSLDAELRVVRISFGSILVPKLVPYLISGSGFRVCQVQLGGE